MIVLGHGSLAFIHLDGEGLGLLGGDGGVPLDERGHHSPSSLNTQRQRSNIQEQQVRYGLGGVSSEDGGLDSSSIGHSLVRVDALVQLLAIEEVLQQLLDLGDSGGSSNQDNVIDGALVHLGISHGLLHRLQSSLEQVRAELLEPGPGDAGVEINSLEQRINLNVGLG